MGFLVGLITVGVLVLFLAATVVVLWRALERKDRQVRAEREAWTVERRELNQRIQAPEIATTEAIGVESQGFVSPDDDAAFWEDYHARTVTHG